MSNNETFHGLEIKSRVGKSAPGTDRYEQLTWAIRAWMRAAFGTEQNTTQCEAAARELEIERDHGIIVHINRRTG